MEYLYVCDLAEWGVIIDDAAVTKQMLDDFWIPAWKASFYPGDCEVQDVMDGLKVDRDGEVINTDLISNTNKDQLITNMAGREISQILPIFKEEIKSTVN